MKTKSTWSSFILFIVLIMPSFSAENEETIRVHVWDSAMNGGVHYGHISLQTPRMYISLWPSEDDRLDLPNVGCVKARARYNQNYADDVRDEEERRADSSYYLSISARSVHEIEAEWGRLSTQPLIWFALGTSISINTDQLTLNEAAIAHIRTLNDNPLAFNCASVVYHLLTVSGGLSLSQFVQGAFCPHGPLFQSMVVSVLSKSGNFDNLRENAKFFEKIIYPDKLGFMVRHKIAKEIQTDLGYFSFGLSDADVDYLWDNFLKTESSRNNNIHKEGLNHEAISSYIRGKFDQSGVGRIYNKFK